MRIGIPDRHIPVKHTYSLWEFGSLSPHGNMLRMNNIASIRKSKGLSQVELAEMVGVEQPTISKLERGNESVTLRTLLAVADALNVPIGDFFADRTSAEQAIIEAYRSLPEQRRRGWEDMAKMVVNEIDQSQQQSSQENGQTAGQS